MAQLLNRLNAKSLKALPAGAHADGGGLYLQVDKTGARRWILLVRFRGRRLEMGLGPLSALPLAEARQAAIEARRLAKAGIDPIRERRAQRAASVAQPFADVARQVVEDLRPGWRNDKVPHQWLTTLTVDAKALGRIPVSDITTDDVLGVLRPIWMKKPVTASRLRGRIERVLDVAKAKGQREGDNPARWRGHLSILLPKQRRQQAHFAALPYDQVKTFMASLQARRAPAASALQFAILTNARSGDVFGATGAEIDLQRRIWTIPADRTKPGKEYRIPLTAQALAIARIRMGIGGRGLLFPGMKRGRPLSNMAMGNVLRRMDYGHITVHGFRATFKSWATDQTEFPREIIEQAMGHLVGDKAEQAYLRSDALERRRALLEAWAAHCLPLAADVVPLRA